MVRVSVLVQDSQRKLTGSRMNKFLALVCCLAALVSAQPDGYNYQPGFSGDSSSGLSAPANSYAAAASGEDGVNVGFDGGASSSSGSVNFLAPEYDVGTITPGNTVFSSSGSGFGSSGSLSGSESSFGSGNFVSGGGLVGSGSGYSSGGRYASGNLGLSSFNLGSVGGGASFGGSSLGGGSSFGGSSLGGGASFGGSSLGGGASFGGSSLGGGSSFGGSSLGGAQSFGGASLGGSFGLSQGYSGGAGSFGGGQVVPQQYAPHFQAPLITKSFYVHSAPEDHEEQQIVRYVTIGRPQKNYRVVFINAPSSTSTKAKIIAQVAPVEDKTAIYVLSKKSNDLDISADVVSKAPVAPSKPDVFFIKYKNPAEALRAQRVIQTQYDQLGGTSSFSNEGVIPVQSVIGSAGESSDATSTFASSQGATQADFSGASNGADFGISNIASSPVQPGQTNINIGTVGKPLLVPAGQSSGSSGSISTNYVTTPLVLSSGGSSGGSSSFGFGSSGGSSSGSSFGGFGSGLSSGVSSSFGGFGTGLSSGGSGLSFGGLSTDQSQFDQVSGGKLQTYLPPSYRRY